MKIAVFGRELKAESIPHIQSMFDCLFAKGYQILVEQDYLAQLKPAINFGGNIQSCATNQDLTDTADFIFSLGGDGTLLNSVLLANHSQTPIMGINFGRLGFLTSVSKADINLALDLLENSDYFIDERSLLHFDCNEALFGTTPFALNEFTIHKLDTSAMINIHTYINGEFLNSYWADGLIVSTPTGSTGYSLSCGGPIIAPRSSNFVLTPVAPHNLNVRPIVVPDNAHLTFEVEGRSEEFSCTLDSRISLFNQSHKISIKKEDFNAKLVRFKGHNFLSTLRNKLMWGADSRINPK